MWRPLTGHFCLSNLCQKISNENWFELLQLSQKCHLNDLEISVRMFCITNFMSISESDCLKYVDFNNIKGILADCNHTKDVSVETRKLQVVWDWIDKERLQHYQELLSLIHIDILSVDAIRLLESSENKVFFEHSATKKFLEKVKSFNKSKRRKSRVTNRYSKEDAEEKSYAVLDDIEHEDESEPIEEPSYDHDVTKTGESEEAVAEAIQDYIDGVVKEESKSEKSKPKAKKPPKAKPKASKQGGQVAKTEKKAKGPVKRKAGKSNKNSESKIDDKNRDNDGNKSGEPAIKKIKTEKKDEDSGLTAETVNEELQTNNVGECDGETENSESKIKEENVTSQKSPKGKRGRPAMSAEERERIKKESECHV